AGFAQPPPVVQRIRTGFESFLKILYTPKLPVEARFPPSFFLIMYIYALFQQLPFVIVPLIRATFGIHCPLSPFIHHLFTRTVGGQFFQLVILEIRLSFTHQYPIAVVRFQLQATVFIPPLFLSLLAALVVFPAYFCRVTVFIPSPVITDKRTRTIVSVNTFLPAVSVVVERFKRSCQHALFIVCPPGKCTILSPGFPLAGGLALFVVPPAFGKLSIRVV